ncbi:MAG: hypothetical protein INQ03_25775 [Candidatus Heimdallarchaeota archaeon]|nr:hypothetical protein [Candidatus Heimdallarchaeota archaeon]
MKSIIFSHTNLIWESLFYPTQFDISKFRDNFVRQFIEDLRQQNNRISVLDDFESPFLDSVFPESKAYLDDFFKFMDTYKNKEDLVNNYVNMLKEKFPKQYKDGIKQSLNPDLDVFKSVNEGETIYHFKFKPTDKVTRHFSRSEFWMQEIDEIISSEDEKEMALYNLQRLIRMSQDLKLKNLVDVQFTFLEHNFSIGMINYILSMDEIVYFIRGDTKTDLKLIIPQLKTILELVEITPPAKIILLSKEHTVIEFQELFDMVLEYHDYFKYLQPISRDKIRQYLKKIHFKQFFISSSNEEDIAKEVLSPEFYDFIDL